MNDLHEIQNLKEENEKLRAAISLIINHLGNGSGVSPDCSIDFLTVDCPNEVRLVIQELRYTNNSLKQALNIK